MRLTEPSFAFRAEQLKNYSETGYELIPLNGVNDLDAQGRSRGKIPRDKGWRVARALSVDDAVEHLCGGANVGVRMRSCDLIVDIDPRNFADGDDPVQRLQTDVGINLDHYPQVETGSGGRHIYMVLPKAVPVRQTLPDYHGIDFKGFGGQVVAAGSLHPETGRPYVWDPLFKPLSRVGNAPDALIQAIRRPEQAAPADAGELSPEALEVMLEALDPMQYQDQQSWLELMMACHHATAGEGRDEFIAWSTSDPQYSGDGWIIGRRWDSLHADTSGRRITKRTLFQQLVKAGRADLLPRDSAAEDFAGVEASAVSGSDTGGVADEWVYVIDAEVFVRRSDGKKWKKDQWRACYAGLREGDVVNAVFKGTLPVPRFEALVYVPGAEEFPDGQYGKRYNIWRPSGVEAKRGDVAPFLDHMEFMFEDELERNYVLDYLAMLVQWPNQKVNYALLVKGGQGTGKSWIGRLMTRIIGQANVVRPSNDEVTSRWTTWTEGAQLAIIEELMARGRIDMANRLKPIITEPTLRIETKGFPHYSIPNHLNLISFTNHEDALPIEHGDRRWLVVFSDAKPREDAYYEHLFRFLDGDGPAAVKWWLLERQIGLAPKGMAPRTRGKAEMRQLSLGEAEQHLMELLKEGASPFDFDLVRLQDVIDAVPIEIQRRVKKVKQRAAKWLREEVGAIDHTRYTKQDSSNRPAIQLWSIRDHEHWRQAGAASRIDAWQIHADTSGATDP